MRHLAMASTVDAKLCRLEALLILVTLYNYLITLHYSEPFLLLRTVTFSFKNYSIENRWLLCNNTVTTKTISVTLLLYPGFLELVREACEYELS